MVLTDSFNGVIQLVPRYLVVVGQTESTDSFDALPGVPEVVLCWDRHEDINVRFRDVVDRVARFRCAVDVHSEFLVLGDSPEGFASEDRLTFSGNALGPPRGRFVAVGDDVFVPFAVGIEETVRRVVPDLVSAALDFVGVAYLFGAIVGLCRCARVVSIGFLHRRFLSLDLVLGPSASLDLM